MVFKTSVTILFISLFMLAQYGKQLAYLQCKVENFTGKTNTATCDCENDYGKNLDKMIIRMKMRRRCWGR